MSSVTIIIPPVLRRCFGGLSQTEVGASTLGEALDHFAGRAGQAGALMMASDGALQRFVRVFVDGRPVRSRADLDAAVPDGARVTILLALAGG